MLEIRQGDAEAFHRLVQHYGRAVSSFFVRSGADIQTAEDLCQETFLRVWRARERYEPRAKFRTWLHQIAHRIAINDGTRNRWRRASSMPDHEDEGGPILIDEEQPDTMADREELREQVRNTVASLPESQRTALLLHRFQGLSYDEVGEAMGLGNAAVKSLLFRARENVRKKMAPYLPEEVSDGR